MTINVDPLFRRKVRQIAFDRNISVNELVRRWMNKCIAEEVKQ